MISAIFNNTYASDITIHYIYVNNTQQPTWTCYVNGVATSPAVVPSNSGAQFNITTTVVANYTYDIKLVSAKGNTFEYTGRGTGTGTGPPEFLYLLILTIFILATLAILTTIVISKRKAHAQLEWTSWQYTLVMLPTHGLSRSKRANLNSLFWESMFVFHFSNSTSA
jgi:hypothetical protein